ncbi:MAG: ExbD/TolR family protein [Gemmatimonadota bacterium]
MDSTSPGRLDAEMNVTPMIDVLLVLLIIYMTSIGIRKAIPATLPEPAAAPTADATQIVLELDADGGLALNGQPVPADALEATLRAVYGDRPAKLLFIRSSGRRTYQEVIDAMNVAREAGVQLIGILPAGGR